MENEQLQASHQTQFLSTWVEYLAQPPFSSASLKDDAKALMQAVVDAMQEGNSCVPASAEQTQALSNLVTQIGLEQSKVTPFIYERGQLYLYRYWKLEHSVATHIARIQRNQIAQVSLTEQYQSLLSDPQQKKALEMVASQGLSIITGGPGTGKTYTLAHIIAVLSEALPNIRIAMVAPTGKAAQRMKEALQKALHSQALSAFDLAKLKLLQPVTLHRLLGLGHTGQPRFHAKQPLSYDVIVVDETSMLDLNLSQMLFAAVPKQARLILLGDADQLASVDVGTVLADLQQVPSLEHNRVNLVTTRRFADGAKIGALARFIQQPLQVESALAAFESDIIQATELKAIDLNKVVIDQLQLEYLVQDDLYSQLDRYYEKLMYGYQNYVDKLKQNRHELAFDEYVQQVITTFDEYRILTAIRHGALGLYKLNLQIEQGLLNQLGKMKQGDWYEGRPVMITYNDYQLGLSNGDIGICFMRESSGIRQYEVYFPSLEKWVLATRLPKNIETAFVLTIHKSQGSEFTHTAVVLDHSAKGLLSKELIYTAITRAKKVVSLLVSREAFTQALCVRTTRHSGLTEKIIEQCRNIESIN